MVVRVKQASMVVVELRNECGREEREQCETGPPAIDMGRIVRYTF